MPTQEATGNMSRGLLVAGVLLVSNACVADLEPWASKARPDDIRRQRVERITDARHAYTVLQKGTMDGSNCRPPIGYGAWHQTWESNRQVRLENLGDTDIVNPWLSNGHNDFRTIEQIVAGALQPGMTDKEKAIAVWRWEMNHRFHAYTADDEVNDPVKVFNVYGYTLCGNDAICLSGLWRTAGLKVRPARPTGHCVTEVLYDNAWHLLDGDEHCLFLLRDNVTIASEAQIVRDHDLIKRTHTYGILRPEGRETDEFSASLYVHEGPYHGDYASHIKHTMHFRLRPGEALTWGWAKATKGFPYPDGLKKPNRCLGAWRYAPDLAKPTGALGMSGKKGVAFADGKNPALRPAAAKREASVTFAIACPYVIVGGRITAQGRQRGNADTLAFDLSFDGKTWQPLTPKVAKGTVTLDAAIDPLLKPTKVPRYRYWVRVRMRASAQPGDVGLDRIAFASDLQMAHLSLPALELGTNRVAYVDDTKGPRRVKLTHEWVESTASLPPAAPPAPVFPPDGGKPEGTKLTFKWQAPGDADGDAIADYHFQLSDRADMRWPLSPNFNKLTSKTPAKGKPQWAVPYAGLLNPGQTYYWRVQARDAKGVWSAWSKVWTFAPQGPGVPLGLGARTDRTARTVTLRWRPNPKGRRPVRYKVYGSNEKGFTASDEPYTMLVNGMQVRNDAFGDRRARVPANLIGTTDTPSMVVVGPKCTHPNMNKTFYRVVAIDAKGIESGPSGLGGLRRPFIHTLPPARAVVGQKLEYRVGTLSSLGDLRSRTFDRQHIYNASFWDRDEPRFHLLFGPKWLSIDRATGILSGTPSAKDVGKVKVGILADIPKVATDTQQFDLEVVAKP